MTVNKDPSGRRWVSAEVEVPGTPEEVWEAIATGGGVSSWFVPTEAETDASGRPVRVVSRFGPGMEAVATPTVWDPPRRFAAEGEGFGPSAPPLATEWIVEARAGGTCVVRVVHSLFTDSDEWDDQLDGIGSGWPDFFRILWVYLTHFQGRTGTTVQLMGAAPPPVDAAWDALAAPLGLADAAVGRRWAAPDGVPPLAGVVEQPGGGMHTHQCLLRLDVPTPGIAHLFALPMGGQVFLVMRLYLYGEQAAAVAARDEPRWQEWMQARLSGGF